MARLRLRKRADASFAVQGPAVVLDKLVRRKCVRSVQYVQANVFGECQLAKSERQPPIPALTGDPVLNLSLNPRGERRRGRGGMGGDGSGIHQGRPSGRKNR